MLKSLFKQLQIEYKISYIFSVILFIFATLTCYYMDLQSLTIWTINVWETIYETGNPLNYYAYSAQNLFGLSHAMVGSDILIYLPWTIWNLPLWILQRFFGLMVLEHPLMLLYSKLFLILVLIFSCVVFKKIANLLTNDTANMAKNLALYCSSFFILTGIAYIGQNDIPVILFMLLAIFNLLKGNMRKFVLWSALSIALKPFFIFSYIALILLKEKKVVRIGLYGLAGMSIYFIQKLPFLSAPMYKESLSYGPTNNVLGLLLKSTIDISPVGISIFVLSLLVIYVMAYMDDTKKGNNERIIYYCTLPFICFFAFTNFESYRPIYLYTLLFLLMLIKPQYHRINLWLETVSTSCLIVYYMISDILFYNGNYIYLPFKNSTSQTMNQFFTEHLPSAGLSAFMTVFVFCMILISIINHPKFKSENPVLLMKEEKYLVLIRSLIFAIPFIFSVVLKFV